MLCCIVVCVVVVRCGVSCVDAAWWVCVVLRCMSVHGMPVGVCMSGCCIVTCVAVCHCVLACCCVVV